MKLIIILLAVFVTTSSAQFRNTEWGMTMKQVIRLEKSKNCEIRELDEDEIVPHAPVYSEYVCEPDTLFGLRAIIWYFFYDDKLANTWYSLYSREDRFSQYNKIKDKYIFKYGEPKTDYSSESVWITDNSKIVISLINYNIHIEYESLKYVHLKEEYKTKREQYRLNPHLKSNEDEYDKY